MEIMTRILAPHTFLDLYEGDALIGTLDYMPTPPEIQIIDITIKEPYRNKGYGKKLMQELINIAKKENCTKIFLEVRVSNTVASHLYGNFGFIETGKRKNYYSGPTEDALMMEYIL